MLLDISKGLSFFATLFSLYAVVASAFLTPQLRWHDRLAVTLPRVLVAGLIALAAGCIFRRSAAYRAGSRHTLINTLPVRLFLGAVALLTVLYGLAWYFACEAPLSEIVPYACR